MEFVLKKTQRHKDFFSNLCVFADVAVWVESLLPLDIAARRLILTTQDLSRAREWLAQKLSTRKVMQTQPAQANPRMEALLNAKSRVHENIEPAQEKIIEALALPKERRDNVNNVEETQNTPKPEQTASTTSALLARKKNLRK
jgi:hypothetical protein